MPTDRKSKSAWRGLSLVGALLFAAPAAAQDQTEGQVATLPSVVKNSGDWSVRCFAVDSPSPCDMYEQLVAKDSRQQILGFSIAYMPASDRHVVQIAVPLGVAIRQGLVIRTASFASPKMAFRRCDTRGCYVEAVMEGDVIASLAGSGPDGSVQIADKDGKDFTIRFSLSGFSAAHSMMVDLARQKTRARAK